MITVLKSVYQFLANLFLCIPEDNSSYFQTATVINIFDLKTATVMVVGMPTSKLGASKQSTENLASECELSLRGFGW